jgi:hypothetical protein
MRANLFAIAVVGAALCGVPSTVAAPAGGLALLQEMNAGALVTEVQIRQCRKFIRYHGKLCKWSACGVPLPGTHKSRCGYRCPGVHGLVWSGWC